MKGLKDIDLYFINDSSLSKKSNTDDIRAAIRAGAKIVQYREKQKTTKDMVEEAGKIKNICQDTLLLINDRIDICLAVDADGVHLGQGDMPYEMARKILGGRIIGITAHNIEEAIEAEKKGADYIGLSPIFETKTKPDAGKPSGIRLIEDEKKKVGIPMVVIGGLNKGNIASVINAGADSCAVISAIITKDDVEKEAKCFIETIKKEK